MSLKLNIEVNPKEGGTSTGVRTEVTRLKMPQVPGTMTFYHDGQSVKLEVLGIEQHAMPPLVRLAGSRAQMDMLDEHFGWTAF